MRTQVDTLTCDLIRLKRMDALAKSFIKLAERKHVRICREYPVISWRNCVLRMLTGFEVSDGFLIKSYTSRPTTPLPATQSWGETRTSQSEESADQADKPPEQGKEGESEVPPPNARVVSAVYLVEPYRRSPAVMRYSGTLSANWSGDQRSTTMGAFAHYMAQETGCRCIFGDIQGAYLHIHSQRRGNQRLRFSI